MNKAYRLFAIGALAIGGSAAADSPVAAGWIPEIGSFDGFIHFCGDSIGGEIVEQRPDGTVVSRGKMNRGNRWQTGNPLVDGTETNMVSAAFDPQIGRGVATIVGRLAPSAHAGTWLNWQALTLGAQGDSSVGFGIGDGALAGKLMWFATGPVERVDESPCGPAFSVPLRGAIIVFR